MIYPLATAEELMAELGKLIKHTRSVRRLTAADLANASQSSVEEIEQMESGRGGDLLTLLRIAQTLHVTDGLMKAFQPLPASLDEIERIEEVIQMEIELKTRSLSEPFA